MQSTDVLHTNVCMYACMYVYMYVCMIYVCMHNICMYACVIYVCVHVCMYHKNQDIFPQHWVITPRSSSHPHWVITPRSSSHPHWSSTYHTQHWVILTPTLVITSRSSSQQPTVLRCTANTNPELTMLTGGG